VKRATARILRSSFRYPAFVTLVALAVTAVSAQDTFQRRGFTIQITDPVNQGVVFGKTRIAAEVKIDEKNMLDRVEFMVGDEVVFIDREAPFETFHDFGDEVRSWIIRAVAYHREGISVSDAVISRRASFSAIERVNRVILWVTVTDKKGNLITDLGREQFTVTEDGTQQKIIDFYPEDRPITLAILIDTSGSMRGKMDQVHAAAGSFVDTLRPDDRALVIDFDDKVFLIQDLTADHEDLKEAITSTEPLGSTSVYDALHASYRKIGQIKGRKAIVLLSDGDDTSSQFGFNRVLEEAKGHDTIIYAIGLGGGPAGGPRKNVLKEFSETTGGRAFFVAKAEQLAEVYQQIAEELRKQYYLTYSTDNETWDGRFIKIKVDHANEAYKVRSRRGYFAVRSPAGATASTSGP
jgi:Ca-activated chloride channel family protein